MVCGPGVLPRAGKLAAAALGFAAAAIAAIFLAAALLAAMLLAARLAAGLGFAAAGSFATALGFAATRVAATAQHRIQQFETVRLLSGAQAGAQYERANKHAPFHRTTSPFRPNRGWVLRPV